MKQYIVLASSIALGVFIFGIIVGGDDSLMETVKVIWSDGVSIRANYP